MKTQKDLLRLKATENRTEKLIELVKKEIRHIVYERKEKLKMNLSDHLHQKIGYHYTYMANSFYKNTGESIQSYLIKNKIERVKEMMPNQTLTSIAFELDYSSVAHLSNQFKQIVGINPKSYLENLRSQQLQNQSQAV